MAFKANDVVRINDVNVARHNLPIGTEVVISRISGNGASRLYYGRAKGYECNGEYSFNPNQLDPLVVNKEQLVKEKEELLAKIKEVDQKIEFIEQNGFETFDPVEFKCFQALTIASNTKAGKAAQAKALAKLVRGE